MSPLLAAAVALHDHYAPGLEGDIEFYVEEARRAGSEVLELGCGTGRILVPIAEAGVPVVGLDLSDGMLELARGKVGRLPEASQHRVELVRGDMRSFALGRRFQRVFVPYRGFLYLRERHEARTALGNIRDHLLPDGRLVFNLFDPDPGTLAANSGPRSGTVRHLSKFRNPDNGHRVEVSETRRYQPAEQLLDHCFLLEEYDAAGTLVSKISSPRTVRYYHRFEMENLLELCGFAVEALYGDFHRGPFRAGGEQIWVARRR